jgi:ribosomal-protein-alanine N-acetyltransferase
MKPLRLTYGKIFASKRLYTVKLDSRLTKTPNIVILCYDMDEVSDMHVPTIQTQRLTLRTIEFADTDAIHRIKGIDPNSADEWIVRVLDLEQPKSYVWAIELAHEVIGTICYWNIHDEQAEIGYDIDPAYQRRGFATEAGEGILALAAEFGFKKLEAYCQPSNTPSQHVAMKLGFKLSGKTAVFNIYTKEV